MSTDAVSGIHMREGRGSSRRLMFGVAVLLTAGAALYGGIQIVRPAPARHPLSGRQIAGIATNAAWLDRAEREHEEAPDQALALIGIRPGMAVADVGAGTGYMTTRLARLVGPDGKVFATEIQPAMLAIIQERVQTQRLSNVVVIRGTETDVNLPANGIDLELLVDVYHELSHPQEMLRSLRRALKTQGVLALVEYRGEDPNIPIAPTHRMSVADARTEVEAEGFTFDRLIPGLPRQHVMVFRR